MQHNVGRAKYSEENCLAALELNLGFRVEKSLFAGLTSLLLVATFSQFKSINTVAFLLSVDLENLSSDDVVLTSVAASVGDAVAAGDLCAPPAAAMSPDNNHNHQPLADQTPDQDQEQTSRIVSSPPEGESRRIFVGNDPGGAGLQGLLMVKVRKDADDRQDEVEVMGDDSEVMTNGGGTTVTDEVPQRRSMLRRGLLGEEEEKILEEYLQRSDTAVIFPEPVEQGM